MTSHKTVTFCGWTAHEYWGSAASHMYFVSYCISASEMKLHLKTTLCPRCWVLNNRCLKHLAEGQYVLISLFAYCIIGVNPSYLLFQHSEWDMSLSCSSRRCRSSQKLLLHGLHCYWSLQAVLLCAVCAGFLWC
jgi:hypothetical protein